MISISEIAARKIRTLMAKQGIDEGGLRVGVKGGGCSGLMYQLTIDENAAETDEVIANGEVRIVVDRKSKLFLHGLTLDYTSGLNGKGFVFSNPNAKATCGCGESFTV